MSAPMGAAAPSIDDRGTQAQYRRFWRWHFYAAFLVIPFVLWQGVTGVVYLWHEQIADALWPTLRFVEAGPDHDASAARVDLDTQLRAVTPAQEASSTEASLKSVRIPKDVDRSTMFVFADGETLSSPRFVDPYTGRALGAVPSSAWLPGLTRGLHGGWPLGKPGSWLLELGACWTMVMVVSGLYLWWPRGARGMAGVLYPRLRAGSRVLWRDLHTVVGVWFAGVFLAFLVTALPWTDAWGNHVLRPIQRALGQTAPAALGFGHGAHAGAHAGHVRPLALQRALETARAEGLSGELEMRIGAQGGPVTVTELVGRTSRERVLSLERDTGRILDRADWDDYRAIPKAIATGVDLHEGSFFGTANRVFNTAVVLALFWLVATGAIGWYRRRPGRGLAAPARVPQVWPTWLRWPALAACVAMPLFGISVTVVAVVDTLVQRGARTAA